MNSSNDYRVAYDKARRELAELMEGEERAERRKVELRRTIAALADLCEGGGIPISPSEEAEYLLANSSLADEIRTILRSQYPGWWRPGQVRDELKRLGHDLSEYGNPQAAIHMVLKRLVQAKEAQTMQDGDMKQIYRMPSTWQSITENALDRSKRQATALGTNPLLGKKLNR